jgi:hypothetical protein
MARIAAPVHYGDKMPDISRQKIDACIRSNHKSEVEVSSHPYFDES